MIVGLTGGIASGKTTASDIFASLGVQVIDTDLIAHDLMINENDVRIAISQRYDAGIVNTTGYINRVLLRKMVIEADDLQWLEDLLHPLIREKAMAAIKPSATGYSLLVVPLLFETGFDALVDSTLVVDVDEQTQWYRSMARSSMTEQELAVLTSRQYSRQERLNRADMVLDASLDLATFRQKIISLDKLYREQAKIHISKI